MKLIENIFRLLEDDNSVVSLVHGTEHSSLLDNGFKLLSTKSGSTMTYPKAYYRKPEDDKIVRVSGLNNTGLHYNVLDKDNPDKVLSSHYSAADLLAGRTKEHVKADAAIKSNGWIHDSTENKSRTYKHPDFEGDGHSLKMDISGKSPVFTHAIADKTVKNFPAETSPSIVHSYFKSGVYQTYKNDNLDKPPSFDKFSQLTKNIVNLAKPTVDWQKKSEQ